MTAIRILPAAVADAIAAGEVVERPASVVKELVENALDAGARHISVEVTGAGRNLIRVVDDGAGIPPDELELAFRRHATSKVASLADLAAIATLGFRGEALASIASVSRIDCTSGGSCIRVQGGEVVEQRPTAVSRGTRFEVWDLFANTPARLAFLKSAATENAAVTKTLAAYVLAYPEVAFELRLEGRRVLASPGQGIEAAVAATLPVPPDVRLLPVDATVAEAAIRIGGLTSPPSLNRGDREAIYLAINQRPIVSRQLRYAVEECYAGSLERGRYPVAVLDLRLDPAQVDVNVHPTKREVRLREDGALFQAVQRAVREALTAAPMHAYRLAPRPVTAAAGRGPSLDRLRVVAQAQLQFEEPAPSAGPVELLRPLGQVQDGYLIAEGPDGLVLVDQHAAHERVLHNRFLGAIQNGTLASQQLLLPEAVDIKAADVFALEGAQAPLSRLGFEVELFGQRTLRVLAAPAELPPGRAAAACVELLQQFEEGREAASTTALATTLACHSAVRFGDRMEPTEQRRLLDDLAHAENSLTCPHGRPTRLLLGWHDVKRHFRRNY